MPFPPPAPTSFSLSGSPCPHSPSHSPSARSRYLSSHHMQFAVNELSALPANYIRVIGRDTPVFGNLGTAEIYANQMSLFGLGNSDPILRLCESLRKARQSNQSLGKDSGFSGMSLVNSCNLVRIGLVFGGHRFPAQMLGDQIHQGLAHQAGLAGARYTRDDSEHAERKLDVQLVQVIARDALQFEPATWPSQCS